MIARETLVKIRTEMDAALTLIAQVNGLQSLVAGKSTFKAATRSFNLQVSGLVAGSRAAQASESKEKRAALIAEKETAVPTRKPKTLEALYEHLKALRELAYARGEALLIQDDDGTYTLYLSHPEDGRIDFQYSNPVDVGYQDCFYQDSVKSVRLRKDGMTIEAGSGLEMTIFIAPAQNARNYLPPGFEDEDADGDGDEFPNAPGATRPPESRHVKVDIASLPTPKTLQELANYVTVLHQGRKDKVVVVQPEEGFYEFWGVEVKDGLLHLTYVEFGRKTRMGTTISQNCLRSLRLTGNGFSLKDEDDEPLKVSCLSGDQIERLARRQGYD